MGKFEKEYVVFLFYLYFLFAQILKGKDTSQTSQLHSCCSKHIMMTIIILLFLPMRLSCPFCMSTCSLSVPTLNIIFMSIYHEITHNKMTFKNKCDKKQN